MLLSCRWLRELGPFPDAPRALAEALTARGLTVDAIVPAGDDTVLDVDVPANRPDALGHVGVARELAAHFGVSLVARPSAQPGAGEGVERLAAVSIEAPDGCPRYSATVVRGVRPGPSPPEVTARLTACGLRPISAAVDVSNLVMLELGQPIHCFDLARLAGPRIVVRRARAGESLVTLDGIERRLTPDDLVIADAVRPVALAGIMGGADTGIGEATRDVLVEVAGFEPRGVRRTARRLGIVSDAAYRFERGVDPEAVLPAQEMAVRLLAELCGGVRAPGVLDLRPVPRVSRTLALRPARAALLLGWDPGAEAMAEALDALGLAPLEAAPGRLEVTVPSWRMDLEREVDLIEEVARHLGYDRIPARRPDRISPRAATAEPALEERTRDLLAHLGFHEAFNYAMIAADDDRALAGSDVPGGLRLVNPMAETLAVLRRSILPGLLRAAGHNLRRGVRDVRLFEVGHVFEPPAPGPARSSPGGPAGRARPTLPREPLRAGLVWSGAAEPRHWSHPAREVGFADVAGVVDALLSALCPGLNAARRPAALPGLHPGRTAEWVDADGTVLARAGQVHPDLARALELDAPVLAAEVEVGLVAAVPPRAPARAGVPRVPAVWRDLSLVLPAGRPWADVERELASIPAPAPAAFEVVDRYAGPPLPDDHASVTVRVILHPFDRSPTEGEVEAYRQALVEALRERLGVALRG